LRSSGGSNSGGIHCGLFCGGCALIGCLRDTCSSEDLVCDGLRVRGIERSLRDSGFGGGCAGGTGLGKSGSVIGDTLGDERGTGRASHDFGEGLEGSNNVDGRGHSCKNCHRDLELLKNLGFRDFNITGRLRQTCE